MYNNAYNARNSRAQRTSTPPHTSQRKPAVLKFDVMLRERWVCTMQMPLGLPIGYDGDKPVFQLHRGQLEQYVEQQKPSLINKPWHAELVTKETKELWRY